MMCGSKNKKGQFFSIGTFLLILVLIMIFSYSAAHKERNEAFHVQRLKTAVMSNFVEEFEKEYVGKILETSAKPSIVAYFETNSAPISFEDFTDLMKTGELNGHSFSSLQNLNTDSTLKKVLSIVTFKEGVEPEFEYVLENAQMISHDKINLSFTFNYSFKSDESIWSNKDVKLDLIVSVYSINHPVHRKIINNYWVPDTSGACLARQLFINGNNCVYNMMPFQQPVQNVVT